MDCGLDQSIREDEHEPVVELALALAALRFVPAHIL